MVIFGWMVILLILASAAVGAIAACVDDEKGLGKEFLEGIHAIGYIFLPVAGIMASVPILARLVRGTFGSLFALVGADPAMAATTFIAVDMGGYFLAKDLAASPENWITATMVGYMAGATIVFSIPVGLAMLAKRDHKYMALGVMAGLLSVPIGVFIANLLLWLASPRIRMSTNPADDHALQLSMPQVLRNLAPLALIMTGLALGLRLAPGRMIRLFMGFGRIMGILIKLVLVACIIEYLSQATFEIGVFSWLFGSWILDPVIVDPAQVRKLAETPDALRELHILRALEVAGYIGITLAGAFPMVYLVRRHLSKPIEAVGRKIGLDANGAAGMLAATANILAMFRLVKDMRARDKVLCIAFAVCAAFFFGDHLAVTTNFQPNLLLPVILGKLGGGVCAFLIATWLCVPKALELEQEDMIDDARAVLQLMPAFKDRHEKLAMLAGGLTNRIYQFDSAGERYVLRIFGAGTELLGIDRARERACSEAVARADIGAEVMAHLPAIDAPFEGFCGALVVRFIPGTLLHHATLSDPEMLHRIAHTIKRLHAAPIDDTVAPFVVGDVIRDYVEKATERNVKLPAELNEALALLQRIEKEVASEEPLCLCHNDLLAGNFVDDGQTLRVIDWEYGGRGDRFFDLGNFAANMELTDAQERALLAAYFGEVEPAHHQRLKRMRLASDLREATWSFLQSALSKLDEDFHARGHKYLQRFLADARALGLDK